MSITWNTNICKSRLNYNCKNVYFSSFDYKQKSIGKNKMNKKYVVLKSVFFNVIII